jgi:hypothetical protein
MLLAVVLLALATFALRAAGAVARVPDTLARRTAGLAPALLAALVVTQVAGARGGHAEPSQAVAVGVGVALCALRAPFIACIAGAAAAAAALRLLGLG